MGLFDEIKKALEEAMDEARQQSYPTPSGRPAGRQPGQQQARPSQQREAPQRREAPQLDLDGDGMEDPATAEAYRQAQIAARQQAEAARAKERAEERARNDADMQARNQAKRQQGQSKASKPRTALLSIRQQLNNPATLRQAIILSEILNKPIARRR